VSHRNPTTRRPSAGTRHDVRRRRSHHRQRPATRQTGAVVLRACLPEGRTRASDPAFPTRRRTRMSADAFQRFVPRHAATAARYCPSTMSKYVTRTPCGTPRLSGLPTPRGTCVQRCDAPMPYEYPVLVRQVGNVVLRDHLIDLPFQAERAVSPWVRSPEGRGGQQPFFKRIEKGRIPAGTPVACKRSGAWSASCWA
jgi:hypothetical protein